jgi:hypothetical protein
MGSLVRYKTEVPAPFRCWYSVFLLFADLVFVLTLESCVPNVAISWTDPRLNPQFRASFVPNFPFHGSTSRGVPYWIAPTDTFHVKWNSLQVDICAATGHGSGPLLDFCTPPRTLTCGSTGIKLADPGSVLGGLFNATNGSPVFTGQTWSWPTQNPLPPSPQPWFSACLDSTTQPMIPFTSGGTFQVAVTGKDHFNGGAPATGEAIAIDPQTSQPATLSLINLLGTSTVVLSEHIKGVPFARNFPLTPTADGTPGGEKRWLFDSTGVDFSANFSDTIQVTQVRIYSASSGNPFSSQTVPFCYIQVLNQRGARCDSNCTVSNASDCSADLLPGSSACQSDIRATPASLNGAPAAWVIGFDTPGAANSRCPVPSVPLWINFTLFHIP